MSGNNQQRNSATAPPSDNNAIVNAGGSREASAFWPEVLPQLEGDPSYLNGEAQCIVCMNPFTTKDRTGPTISHDLIDSTCGPLVILPCGHLMGLPCLNAWLETQDGPKTCSICRAELQHPRCKHQISLARFWPGTSERQQRVTPDVQVHEYCHVCRLIDTFRKHICALSSQIFNGAVLDFDFVAYSHVIDETISKRFRVKFSYSRNSILQNTADQIDSGVLRGRAFAALEQYKRDGTTSYQPGGIIVRIRHYENVVGTGPSVYTMNLDNWLYRSLPAIELHTPDAELAGYPHPLLEFSPDIARVRAGDHEPQQTPPHRDMSPARGAGRSLLDDPRNYGDDFDPGHLPGPVNDRWGSPVRDTRRNSFGPDYHRHVPDIYQGPAHGHHPRDENYRNGPDSDLDPHPWTPFRGGARPHNPSSRLDTIRRPYRMNNPTPLETLLEQFNLYSPRRVVQDRDRDPSREARIGGSFIMPGGIGSALVYGGQAEHNDRHQSRESRHRDLDLERRARFSRR